jgi:serine/threonine protein kinase
LLRSESSGSQAQDIEIAGYRIVHRIGRGAMGAVYLGEHRERKWRRAIKLLKSSAADTVAQRRFEREADAGERVREKDPGVATVFDAGRDHGVPYIVMEYIEGWDLGRILSELGSLRHRVALNLVAGVARELMALQDAGIVHRDIKPTNLVLSGSGRVRIVDFGLARPVTFDPALLPITRTEKQPHTPLYASPEQLEMRPCGLRTDIYSLGLVLFEMLEGTDALKAWRKEKRSLSVTRCPEGIRGEVNHLLSRMTAEDPADRPSPEDVVIGAELLLVRAGRQDASTSETLSEVDDRSLLRTFAGEVEEVLGRPGPDPTWSREEDELLDPLRPDARADALRETVVDDSGSKESWHAPVLRVTGAVLVVGTVLVLTLWPRSDGDGGLTGPAAPTIEKSDARDGNSPADTALVTTPNPARALPGAPAEPDSITVTIRSKAPSYWINGDRYGNGMGIRTLRLAVGPAVLTDFHEHRVEKSLHLEDDGAVWVLDFERGVLEPRSEPEDLLDRIKADEGSTTDETTLGL